MKSVTIDECTEGYLVKEVSTDKAYAISKERLVQKIKELFGIADIIVPDAPIVNLKITDPFSGNTPQSLDEQRIPKNPNTETNPLSSPFVFSEITPFEVLEYPDLHPAQPITTGKSRYWLYPGGKKIRISREGYPSVFVHANVSDLKYIIEHPAEQKRIIHNFGKATYENKAVILRGFLKDVKLSALVGDTHNNGAFLAKGTHHEEQPDE